MRHAPARHAPDQPPRWARRFVAAYLAVFLVCGLAGFEAWPLTGWRLFADARQARQPRFQAAVCQAWAEAVRDRGGEVAEVRIYQTVTDVSRRVGDRGAPPERTLRFTCRDGA